MSIKHKEGKPVLEYNGFTCDKCKKEHGASDFISKNEALFINKSNGFGSVWGYATMWSLSLCDKCCYDLLSPYAVIESEVIE